MKVSKSRNIMDKWPELNENELFVGRFNIYSGMIIQTNKICICTDLSKLPEPLVNKFQPDYIILSHMSLDHFDKKEILRHYSNKTKVLCSPQCFERLYRDVKNENKQENLYLAIRDYIYEDDLVRVEFYQSIHGDYLEPLTFTITLKETDFKIYHGTDSEILKSYEAIKKDKIPDLAILPMSIAPGLSAQTFNELVSAVRAKLSVTNHVLSEIVEGYKNDAPDSIKILDWNQYIIIEKQKGVYQKKEYTEGLESAISQVHLDTADIDLIARGLKSKDSMVQYKSLLGATIIALSHKKDFKQLFLKESIQLVKNLVKKGDYSSSIYSNIIAAALWSIGNYYSDGEENFEDSELLELVLSKNDQYLNYWLCECITHLGLGNATNYEIAKNIFNQFKKSKAWNEVLNRRVFAWSKYHTLDNANKQMELEDEEYLSLFLEFLEDENPDVRLIGIMGIGLIIRRKDEKSDITDILEIEAKMLEDTEFELVESALDQLLQICEKFPSFRKKIIELVEASSVLDLHDNWYVKYKYEKLISKDDKSD
ncbi:MAG: MBL fold metallo-hydrolase [Candidatus Heimdallarchaeaceae archaeon]